MKIYAYTHNPIPFDFKQTIDRFFVEEIPLFRFSGHGNNLILKIKKSDMSTWKLVHVLSKATGLNERDIGYAGLKDKSATAIQYISIPKQCERELKNLTTEKIEILEKTYNKAPIKIGQLKGNKFSIVLHQPTVDASTYFEQKEDGIHISSMRAQRIYNNNKWHNPLVLKITNAQPALVPPIIETVNTEKTTQDKLILKGKVIHIGDTESVKAGFQFREFAGFGEELYSNEWQETKTIEISKNGEFKIPLSIKKEGKTYQFRAFIDHPKLRVYGDI